MRKKSLEIIVVGLFFLLLAVIDTYPLVRYLDKGMPYFPYPEKGHEIGYMVHGDYLQLYYNLWLFKDALSGNIPFFTNPYEFSVGEGYMPSFNPQFLPMSLFFAIFSIPGNIIAYNLLVIISYLLAGLSGYLLVKLYTRSWVPSLLAGVILALFPYRTGELLGGHPNGFLSFLIPLTLYLLERSLRDGNILASLGAGLSVISMSLLEGHLHFYTFLLLSFFLPWRFFFPINGGSEAEGVKPEIHLKDIKIKDALIVFSVGAITGISIILVKARHPLLRDPILYSFLIFPFLLTGFWILYSRLFSLASNIPFEKSLKEDVLTYCPLSLFLLYLIRTLLPIEHLGKGIAIIALSGVIALKGYRIFRMRERLSERFLKASPFLRQRLLKTILPFLFMCLLTIIWALYTKGHIETSIAGEGRPLTQVMKYSPGIDSLFKRHNPDSAKNIYIGVLPFLLSLVGIFITKGRTRRDTSFFGTVFLVSMLLSFGPNLDPYIHLYTFLYDHLPFFNYPRVAGRMITITIVMAAILSGYSIKGLIERVQGLKWARYRMHDTGHNPPHFPLDKEGIKGGLSVINLVSWILLSLVFIGVILDFLPLRKRGISIVSKGNTVYEEIKRGIGNKKVLEIPIWPGDSAWSSVYQYYVTLYRYRMINGYDPGVSKRYINEIFERLYPIDFGELGYNEYHFLKGLDVKYIVMHEEEFPRKVSPFPFRLSLQNMKRSPYVRFIKRDGPIYLFQVNDDVGYSKRRSFSIKSPVGGLYQSESMARLVGEVVKDRDASAGESVFGKKGAGEGWIQYGPYRTYPTGSYKAIFRMKTTHNPFRDKDIHDVAVIDVSTRMSDRVLAKRVITTEEFKGNGYQDFELPFSLSFPQTLEFRVYYKNIVDLWVDYVYILTSDEIDPRWSYSGDQLFNLPDRIEGPTRRYPAGNYMATFYIRSEGEIMDEVAVIQVISDSGMIGERKIQGKDFPITGGYYPFSLRFKLTRDSFIDFRISSRDMTKIGLKGIEIKRMGDIERNG